MGVKLPTEVVGGFGGGKRRARTTGRTPSAQTLNTGTPQAVYEVPATQTVARGLRRAAGAEAAFARGAGGGLEAFAQLAANLGQRQQHYAFASAKAKLFAADSRIQSSFVGDPDYGTYKERYQEQVEAEYDKLAEGLPRGAQRDFELLRTELTARGQGALAGLAQKQYGDQVRADLVGLRSSTLESALAAGAGGSMAGGIAYQEALAAAAGTGAISHEDAATMSRAWAEDYSTARLEGMAPEARLLALEAGSAVDPISGLRTYQETGHPVDFIPVDKRNEMIGTAQREIVTQQRETRLEAERIERLSKEAEAAAREEQAVDFNRRMWDIEAEPLTIKDIVNSSLTAAQQRTFINALESRQRGEAGTNWTIYNQLYGAVARGEITPDNLYENAWPHHREDGTGIRAEDYGRLHSFAEKIHKQGFGRVLKDFDDMAVRMITARTMFGDDPNAERKLYEFRQDFQKRFDAEVAAGKSPYNLLDPTSPDYLGPMINTYLPTGMQMLDDKAAQIRQMQKLPEPITAPSAPTPPVPYSGPMPPGGLNIPFGNE